jgi:hypothetical protein
MLVHGSVPSDIDASVGQRVAQRHYGRAYIGVFPGSLPESRCAEAPDNLAGVSKQSRHDGDAPLVLAHYRDDRAHMPAGDQYLESE